MEYVHDLLLRAVDDLNANLDPSCQYNYSEEMIFIGKNSELDSMDRVCFIEFIESSVEDERGISLELLNDPRFKKNTSCTFKELELYIEDKLKAEGIYES